MPEQKIITASNTPEQASSVPVVQKTVIITEIVGLEDSGSGASNAKEIKRLSQSIAASNGKLSLRHLLKIVAEEKNYQVKLSTIIAPFKPGVGIVAGMAEYQNSTVFFQEKPADPRELPGATEEAKQIALRPQTLVQKEAETVVEMVVLTPRKQDFIEQPVQTQPVTENPWKEYR